MRNISPNPTTSEYFHIKSPAKYRSDGTETLGGKDFALVSRPTSILVQHTKSVVLIYADLIAALFAFTSSFLLSNTIRERIHVAPLDLNSDGFPLHLAIVGMFTAALFIWFGSKGHYRRREALVDHLPSILSGCGMATLGAAAIQFGTIEVGSRLLTFSYWLILAPSLILGRLTARQLLRSGKVWASNAILFASPDRIHEVSDIVRKHEEFGVRIGARISTIGLDVSDLLHLMRVSANSGSAVIFAPAPGDDSMHEIMCTLVLEGTPFIFSPHIGPVPQRAETHNYPLEDISFVDVRDPLARPIALVVKRIFDLTASLALLIVITPLIIPIALAVLSDGGPAFFRQKRVGRDGKAFDCMKFRSMTTNAEDQLQKMIDTDPAIAAEWKAYQKLKKDPRITWIGRIIRKTNLDELPQLINVLRGDMSLVGPRPMTISQIDDYGMAISAYQRVRPGITGIWQTNGRNQTTFAERARLDAWYVRNWSLWRDFVILIRTIREVLFARGG